jgi:outer membrane lipoprotein SlyB
VAKKPDYNWLDKSFPAPDHFYDIAKPPVPDTGPGDSSTWNAPPGFVPPNLGPGPAIPKALPGASQTSTHVPPPVPDTVVRPTHWGMAADLPIVGPLAGALAVAQGKGAVGGFGAWGGAVAGGAIGTAIGGPIGGVIGTMIGASKGGDIGQKLQKNTMNPDDIGVQSDPGGAFTLLSEKPTAETGNSGGNGGESVRFLRSIDKNISQMVSEGLKTKVSGIMDPKQGVRGDRV